MSLLSLSSPKSLLISATELAQALEQQKRAEQGHVALVILDCRHNLMDHAEGLREYQRAHIPGAQFWNMETDAVAPHHDRSQGRHPLATREETTDKFAQFGIANETLVVVYDAHGGQYAGRLWWLLKWIGHSQVRVLDGGLQAWIQSGAPVESPATTAANNAHAKGELDLLPAQVSWVNRTQIADLIKSKSSQVVDARAPARFRGEQEPLDPVAGHIPTAINRFYQDNLTSTGHFKAPDQLRAEFIALLGNTKPAEVIHQCGSGVTACHNILAMHLAGLEGSSLYPGSWSEWCAYPELPVATGP